MMALLLVSCIPCLRVGNSRSQFIYKSFVQLYIGSQTVH